MHGLLAVLGLLPTRGTALRDHVARRSGRGAGCDGRQRRLEADGEDRERGLGDVLDSYAVRASRANAGAQDGGAVSAILAGLLGSGAIDGALVSKPSDDPDEPWKGVATIARTPAEVYAASGSFYNQTMALAALDLSGYALPANPRIAVVGTSCEIQGLRAMPLRPWSTGAHRVDAVVLHDRAHVHGKSFDYEALILRDCSGTKGRGPRAACEGRRGARAAVSSTSTARSPSTSVSDEFHGAALKGCDECADFLGRAADLSVGSVARSTAGRRVLVPDRAGSVPRSTGRPMLDLRELDDVEPLDPVDG